LHLVKNYNPKAHSRHPVDYPVIADSGANYHMFREREFFHVLTPARGSVILGDGKTTVKIEGVGTVRCKIGPNMLDIPNVRFVPGLSESIYSLHQHIKIPNHGLESSFESGLFVKFPKFQTKAIVGDNNIYLDMLPIMTNHDSISDPVIPTSPSIFCRQVSELVSDINVETVKLDNILRDLRQYYATTKTKRQLGLDVPAGFQCDSSLSKQFKSYQEIIKGLTYYRY
jgi:hypothetical protein